MEFKPSILRLLKCSFWAGVYLLIAVTGLTIMMGTKDSLWVVQVSVIAGLVFLTIPVILHFNYWAFDKGTIFRADELRFYLSNALTNKGISGRPDEIRRVFKVESWLNRVPWSHQYTIVEMKDGRTFQISNYVISPREFISLMNLEGIEGSKKPFIPTIKYGPVDRELRGM